ncbi:flagellar biosynthesis regulator FlaF [Pseudooceanicola sp. CBS1P-1]|uniref:Flagellar biosynthesis regulator FlaF n=1 Tax=Pseudooceanicola albus TaxID=2692189 RepID=A0A6L7G9U6_9RHOB|nr:MULTISPECIES: flagellar biosynthesis regulator FlaF [Pseudooceanicola]MBT9385849.1 flagellar biosynthesis regulator FlaF [Pseudooceanicola endophyticus]MXN20080.1 flagellar biosynthesis regulator FlaF [Pseudooceanicola albus]
MTAHAQALRAYGQASNPIRTPRGTEYEVFARITHRLVAAARKGAARNGADKSSAENFNELARALYENRRLWTLLAADVADAANTLPEALRAQIFYLAEFTQVHSRKVLAGKASPRALIEVNTAVMRGLRAEGAAK